jgi:hypothetical protein
LRFILATPFENRLSDYAGKRLIRKFRAIARIDADASLSAEFQVIMQVGIKRVCCCNAQPYTDWRALKKELFNIRKRLGGQQSLNLQDLSCS